MRGYDDVQELRNFVAALSMPVGGTIVPAVDGLGLSRLSQVRARICATEGPWRHERTPTEG